MLFDGKRAEDLSKEELEAAAVYCTRMADQARQVAELNKAGLVELALEYERRLGIGPQTIN
jgi:hypothetical protein